MRRFFALPFVLALVTPLAAQDAEFIRALEAAQKLRPAQIASTARIAPPSEPGTPLVIHGRVFKEGGSAPLADAVVFAYHTDRNGLYDRPGTVHSWRLKGWAKTDAEGRFEFSTMRPGSYPGGRNPAHVHFTIFMADGTRYHAGELQFEGDPALTERQKSQSASDGVFGDIRPVRREGTVEHVDVNLKVNPAHRF